MKRITDEHGGVYIEAVLVFFILSLLFFWMTGIGRWTRNQLMAVDIASVGGEIAYRDCGFQFTNGEIASCLGKLKTDLENYGTTILKRQIQVVLTHFEGTSGAPVKIFSTADLVGGSPTLGTVKFDAVALTANPRLLSMYNIDNRAFIIEVFVAGGSAWGVAYESAIN